jgi:alkylation response protein AidB-like acyl-CoA dehydrogenase
LPGIELQPLMTIGGDRLNMTFFNDVRVADKYRLGEVDAGWNVLHDPLDSEHGIGDPDEGRLGDIHGQGALSTIPVSVAVARALRWGATTDDHTGAAPMDQPLVAAALARAAVDLEVARNTPGPMGKVAASEAYARIAAGLLDVTSLLGTISQGDPDALEAGAFDWAQRRAQAPSIAGGTVEVFKNIVAETVLGLPKQLPSSGR